MGVGDGPALTIEVFGGFDHGLGHPFMCVLRSAHEIEAFAAGDALMLILGIKTDA